MLRIIFQVKSDDHDGRTLRAVVILLFCSRDSAEEPHATSAQPRMFFG